MNFIILRSPICVLLLIFCTQIKWINACSMRIRMPSPNEPSDAYSMADLVHLANFERKLYEDVIEIITKLPDNNATLKNYIIDYEETSAQGTSHLHDHVHPYDWATVVSSHPFLAYRLIRRILVDLPSVITFLEHQKESALLAKIRSRQRHLKWPTIADKEEIMSRILQIQTVYDFDVEKYSKGADDAVGGSLSEIHCVELGRHAMRIGKYASAVEWLNIAMRKCFSSNRKYMAIEQVAAELSIVIEEHDRILEHQRCRHSGNLKNLWEHDLFQVPVVKLKNFKADRFRHFPQHPNDISFRAMQLCNGTNQQSDESKSKLKCWYDTTKFTFSRISPMKIEMLSRRPYLFRVYDFIGSNGIKNLVVKSFEAINDVAIANALSNINSTSSKNIHGTRPRHNSAIIAMEDENGGLALKNISSILERFISPSHKGDSRGICTGGGLRILQHTFGNSDLHLESPEVGIEPRPLVKEAAKYTSIMIFLNHAELGGLTVFPNIGISVEPVTGSALIWRTWVGGQKRDTRLVHMECPVILGLKWVATKKFRYDAKGRV